MGWSLAALVIVAVVLAFLFLFLVATRSRRVAVGALLAFVALGITNSGEDPRIELVTGLAAATVAVVLLTRFGLLAVAASILTVMVVLAVPLTFDPAAWYFGRSLVGLALILAPGVWGAVQALAGRPILAPLLADGQPAR